MIDFVYYPADQSTTTKEAKLFLFILIFSSTYIHSFTFIHSPVATCRGSSPSPLRWLVSSVGKTSLGCRVCLITSRRSTIWAASHPEAELRRRVTGIFWGKVYRAIVKETARRRIIITSSWNKISSDQLRIRVVVRGGGGGGVGARTQNFLQPGSFTKRQLLIIVNT
jgi:hypothetical protein